MIKYNIDQVSRTVGSVAIAGVIATQFFTAQMGVQKGGEEESFYKRNIYQSSATLPTVDQYRNLLTGDYNQEINRIEATMSELYTKLVTGQESLGAEFEKILYKNLWDLYES